MNDALRVTRLIKDFILSLDDILINFPKKELLLKNRIIDDSYEILKKIYEANESQIEDERIKKLTEVLAILFLLDFYFEKSYKCKYITQKQLNQKLNQLTIISKMIRKWLSYEKSKL